MLEIAGGVVQPNRRLTELGYVQPDFMRRFTYDRRVDYGNLVLELDGDPRFNNLNLFVAAHDETASLRRMVLINPTRYSTQEHAQKGFEEYGVFPLGVHPCEGVMAEIEIRTDAPEGYPAYLVLPEFKIKGEHDDMTEYLQRGLRRHSEYCRTHRMAQLEDQHVVLEDPELRYAALAHEHATAFLNSPDIFRDAPILKMPAVVR
jgi:hypothetical protein